MDSVYTIIYFIAPGILNGTVEFYIAQPLAWFSLATLAYFFRKSIAVAKPALQRRIAFLSLGLGLAQVATFIIAGLFLGFGSPPYAHDLPSMLGNSFYLVSLLLGMELARAALLVSTQRRPFLGVILVSLLMVLLQAPYYKFLSLSGGPAAIRFFGEEILPSFSMNFLASMLTLLGGPLAAILYRAVLLVFEWGSPLLPNLNWAITALIGTVVPMIGIIYVQNRYFAEKSLEETQPTSRRSTTLPWIIVLLIAVFAIWFNLGIFGVRPFLVSGYSMKPAFELGDLVIVQKIKTSEIQVGDVVQYTRENISIVHRVLQIQPSNSGLNFIVKGDNNNVEDPTVSENLVDGKVVAIIPKIGWLSIGIRQVFGWVH